MNPYAKMGIIVALMVAVGAIVVIKHGGMPSCCPPSAASQTEMPPAPAVPATGDVRQYEPSTLPRLVDLGAGKCIPCKMMAPILEQLKTEYQGKLDVIFIDVWENPGADKPYNINLIPTQIFIAPTGAELFRHEGFFSKEDILAKWKELGFDFAVAATPQFSRLEPASPDTRPKDQICYMCEKDIAAKTLVVVKTDKGDVRLCGPHCYFIMYSCLTEDKTDFEKKVTVADFASGRMLPLSEAIYLQGVDAAGRPTLQAYADADAAKQAQQTAGGNVLSFSALQTNELSHRCGFCDRACYPQDAAEVRLEGVQTWGCCSHCALGVAARTGKDIEVREKDRLTGEPIVVRTLNGSIASLEPSTAVAWFGQRKKPDGTWTSAGCFHQGFFVNADNLRKWVEKNPHETGKLITIHQALADKMKLSPEQIQKACKIGECAPK
jgi:thioredoxin 1